MRAVVLALLGFGLPAAADPLDAAAFEARTTGKTISFGLGGAVVGHEEYRPGRRVIWQDAGGACLAGQWFEEAGAICFAYDGGGAPVCWEVTDEAGRLTARSRQFPDNPPLTSMGESAAPLDCPGPLIGA